MKYLNNIEEYIKEDIKHTEIIKNILREGLNGVVYNSHLVNNQISSNIEEFLNELNVNKLTKTVGEIKGILGYGVFGAVFQLDNNKVLKFTFDYHEAPFLYEFGMKNKVKGIVSVDDVFKIKFGNTYAYLIIRDNLEFNNNEKNIMSVITDLKINGINTNTIDKYKKMDSERHGIFLALKSMYDIEPNWRGTHSENIATQNGNIVLYDGFSKSIKLSDSNIPFLNLEKNINESMLNKRTLDQLKKIRKMTKGIDIGDRVPDQSFPNQTEFHNAIDFGVQTYDEYMAEPFEVNQNVKNFKK